MRSSEATATMERAFVRELVMRRTQFLDPGGFLFFRLAILFRSCLAVYAAAAELFWVRIRPRRCKDTFSSQEVLKTG